VDSIRQIIFVRESQDVVPLPCVSDFYLLTSTLRARDTSVA